YICCYFFLMFVYCVFFFFFFFFFQAEDGIRDRTVTGVQTCALPISGPADIELPTRQRMEPGEPVRGCPPGEGISGIVPTAVAVRSEERRVGKECRARWGTK